MRKKQKRFTTGDSIRAVAAILRVRECREAITVTESAYKAARDASREAESQYDRAVSEFHAANDALLALAKGTEP